MDPVEYPITVFQGKTKEFIVTWTDENDDPVSLAGYSARMQIRDKPGGSNLYVSLTSDVDGGLILEPGGATGDVHVRITATETAGIPKTGFYDLELVKNADPDDVVGLLYGKVTLVKQVTLP